MAKKRSSSLGALVESFFHERLIQQRQVSSATLATYKDALRLLLLFVSSQLGKPVDRLDIHDLDYKQILAFLDFLEQGRGNSVRTRNARLAVIHSFFRHVAYRDPEALALAQRILNIGPKRTTKRVVSFLQPAEVDALMTVHDRSIVRGRRDYALLSFLLQTGVRASEAVGLNVADLTLTNPAQVLIRGKGSKERVLPLAGGLVTTLNDLIEERQLPAHTQLPLFVNQQGKRLTRFGLIHIVRRAAQKASEQCATLRQHPVSPHSFRHTTAMRLLQAGVDLVSIRAWLGHADVQTTHHYLEADVDMKRRALVAANIAFDETVRYQPSSELLAFLSR